MKNTTVEFQARMYMFDLDNCAKEYWFKVGEGWDLCLASSEQKAELEKKYHPTVSEKGLPEMLLQLHTLVESKLLKTNPEILTSAHSEQMSAQPDFLVAFNRHRLR
ncbi:hypothetical protein [Desertivirga xinjiangensis]|uniref:hypothetical protein n=1 Tax=Desertivirga xinjiangensis TaxID=539206 RepID=UPI002109E3D3|nr:hypothetical protein [Pedobacter xinjiangensis]